MNNHKKTIYTLIMFVITFLVSYISLSFLSQTKNQFAYSDNQLEKINDCADKLAIEQHLNIIEVNPLYYNDNTAVFVGYHEDKNYEIITSYGLVSLKNDISNNTIANDSCYLISSDKIKYNIKSLNGFENVIIKDNMLYYAVSKVIYDLKSLTTKNEFTIYTYDLINQENEIYLDNILLNDRKDFNLEKYVFNKQQ